jgi:hypothetical protein
MSTTGLLPFQPMSMTPTQLAAVSYLAAVAPGRANQRRSRSRVTPPQATVASQSRALEPWPLSPTHGDERIGSTAFTRSRAFWCSPRASTPPTSCTRPL